MEETTNDTKRTLLLGEAYTHGSDLLSDYTKHLGYFVQPEIKKIYNSMALDVRPREVEVLFSKPKDFFSESETIYQSLFFNRAERSGLNLFPKDGALRLRDLFSDQTRSDGKYYVAMRPVRLHSGKEVIFYLAVLKGVHWLRFEYSTYDTVLRPNTIFLFWRLIV